MTLPYDGSGISLTTREHELLTLVADGHSNQQIANTMVISENTVKKHLKHIFDKLEVRRRTHAVARARDLGLFDHTHLAHADEGATTTNLPQSLMPLIGREHEITALAAHLDDADVRLITLHGPGGVGKTHLAIELAWRYLPEFADGVFFVPLEALEHAEFVISAVAEAVGFQFSGRGSLKEALIEYLHDKQMLLIIDACEQVQASVRLIGDLLTATRTVKILATSRERLNAHGEVLFSLQGTEYPSETSTNNLEHFQAVQLFIHCAKRVQPVFAPDAEQLQPIADICRFVEGLPLGILLAASWVNILSVEEILAELQENAGQLDTDIRGPFFHDQSLQHVFQRSWNLLEPHQRTLIMYLTVFRSPFTREAAAHVAHASVGDIGILVNKSLLNWNPRQKRYHFHALFRQFALSHLQPEGAVETTMRRHYDYFLTFVQPGRDELHATPDLQQEWDASVADLRAALRWSLEMGEPDHVLTLCEAMKPYWHLRGYTQEEFNWLSAALTLIPEPATELHGRSLYKAGYNAFTLGKLELHTVYMQQSLTITQQLNMDLLCGVYIRLADTAHATGQFAEATRYYDEALNVARRTENLHGIGAALNGLGMATAHQRDFAAAVDYYQEGLTIARDMHDDQMIGVILGNLGVMAAHQANWAEAVAYYRESLPIFRDQRSYGQEATGLGNLGEALYKLGDYDEAYMLTVEGIIAADLIDYKMAVAHHLEILARIEGARGNGQHGTQLYGAADALREAIQYPIIEPEMQEYTAGIELLRNALGPDVFAKAWTAGRVMPLEFLIDKLPVDS